MTDIVELAKKSWERDKEAWSSIYTKAADDLKFLSDDECAQWDGQDYNERVRTGRPALTVDQLGQFIHQVANDIRMNTPTIGIIPSDHEASEETAEVYKGLIKEIEYYSAADDVYDTASLNAIRCGIGFIRVDHEYVDDSFEQRICIKRVVNPLSVWIDSDSVEGDGRDAKHATIIQSITVDDFKRKYPKFAPVSFDSDETDKKKLSGGDYISIAEHFRIEEEYQTITGPDGIQSREIVKKTVRRLVLSGQDILEETTFPGKYIPIVPVYGEETWINGKRYLFSLIRKSKSAQQMFNYWKSLETELLMKAPQAPVMAAEGQVEDYAEDWKNPSKASVLRYKLKDAEGNAVGAPQRLEPPKIPTGIVNAARQTVDDIKATMGIYNASLGLRSNEQSGIAIRQRQQEGDVATYHFGDNLVRSLVQVGRIIVGMIPVIYNESRILKTINMEDQAKTVGVNGALVEGQEKTIDLSRGKYDVRVTTGSSTTTMRQEAAEFYSNIVSKMPDLFPVMGDLIFKYSDFAGAQTMAERMKKVIDPKFLEEEGQDPQVQAMKAELEKMAKVIQALQDQLESKQQEFQLKAVSEQNDTQESRAKMEIQLMELQMKDRQAQAELALKEQEIALKARELFLKEQELQQARAVQVLSPMVGGANPNGEA